MLFYAENNQKLSRTFKLGFFQVCQSSSNSIQRNDREQLLNSSFNINSRGSLDCDSLNDVVVTICCLVKIVMKVLINFRFQIVDITESEPTSIVLSFCQRRVTLRKILFFISISPNRTCRLKFNFSVLVFASVCKYPWNCWTQTDDS